MGRTTRAKCGVGVANALEVHAGGWVVAHVGMMPARIKTIFCIYILFRLFIQQKQKQNKAKNLFANRLKARFKAS